MRVSRQIGLGVLVLLLGGLAGAQPLAVQGLDGLYQRILTRSDARLYDAPDAAKALQKLEPLSVYYVFERQSRSGDEWLRIGVDSTASQGWVPEAKTSAWNRTLTGQFSNPLNRQQVLFFEKQADLEKLVTGDGAVGQAQMYQRLLDSGMADDDFPVVAREPDKFIDFEEQFYLLPILDHKHGRFESGSQTVLMKVAALTREGDPGANPSGDPVAGFNAGVVFVIDTTKSMGPYIDRTRDAIKDVYKNMSSSKWAGNVSFGLVAFRDSVELAPELEYASKVVMPLTPMADADVVARLDEVSEAQSSSSGFAEDAFLGIDTALNELDWLGMDARYVILVTDASARSIDDPHSGAGTDSEALSSWAGANGFKLLTMHLQTPAGASRQDRRSDHSVAQSQYQTLTRDEKTGAADYFSIEEGRVDAFQAKVEQLSDTLSKQFELIEAGAQGGTSAPTSTCEPQDIVCSAERAVQAFAVEYFGRLSGTRAPEVVEGWVIDRDIEHQSHVSIYTRVLITRDQLERLYASLGTFLTEAAKSPQPPDLFERLQDLVGAHLADPNRPFLGDQLIPFLEGLPYRSPWLNTTRDEWEEQSGGERNMLIQTLLSKRKIYKHLIQSTDLWVSLGKDEVYALRLEDLP